MNFCTPVHKCSGALVRTKSIEALRNTKVEEPWPIDPTGSFKWQHRVPIEDVPSEVAGVYYVGRGRWRVVWPEDKVTFIKSPHSPGDQIQVEEMTIRVTGVAAQRLRQIKGVELIYSGLIIPPDELMSRFPDGYNAEEEEVAYRELWEKEWAGYSQESWVWVVKFLRVA